MAREDDDESGLVVEVISSRPEYVTGGDAWWRWPCPTGSTPVTWRSRSGAMKEPPLSPPTPKP